MKQKMENEYPFGADGRIDIAGIRERAEAYIEQAEDADRYSVAGLALALDCDVETLSRWSRGIEKAEGEPNRELSRVVNRALTHILKWLMENNQTNRQSKDIFLLKNCFGMEKADEEEGCTFCFSFDMGSLAPFSN